MQAAVAHWPPAGLHQLTTLFRRMVDDFLAYAVTTQVCRPAGAPAVCRRLKRVT